MRSEGFPWGRWLKKAWPALVWVVLLFVQSSIPYDQLPPTPPILGWDKIIHLGLYAVLAYLLLRSRVEGRPSVWIILFFCLAYGASDELHQLAVPGRFASFYDWVADAIGAVLVVAATEWRRKRTTTKVLPSVRDQG